MRFLIGFILFFLLTSNIQLFGQDQYRHIFSDDILFGPGQHELTSVYNKRLEKVAEIINNEEVEKIILYANTDSIGSDESNEKLSFKRAEAIVKFLQRRGVNMRLFDIRTYGEYNPVADNSTAEGRAKNRRVTIHVLAEYDPDRYKSECTIKGVVNDAKSNQPLGNSRILMVYLGGVDTVYTNENGQFEKKFTYMTNVEVRAYAKNYFFVSKLAQLENKKDVNMEFNLEPAIVGGKMFMSNLYFKPGSAFMLPSSELALEGILAFMQYNDHLKFEIAGHINRPNEPKVEESSAPFRLSEARAKAVFLYLTENGIPEDRLSYKGYGNWEMLFPEATSEIQQIQNRRVEIKIIE